MLKELAATAAPRLRAPKLQALRAFHVPLPHTSRCSAEFSSARGGGRGRGGARSAAQRDARRVSEWAKALGREVCSPASWRCVPRRVSAWAKARRPAALPALSTPGGLGRYWVAQWHLARAVGRRFRGCCAKRLYLHTAPYGTKTSAPGCSGGVCVARAVSVERGGMGKRGCARHMGEKVWV